MEIHHLKVFLAVYKNRSFTKASQQLNISQPTISEHIKNLEAELKVRLFDRMGRSILPTREADVLYPRALQLIEDHGKIQEELAAERNILRGQLVLGASTIPGTYILPAMAMAFKKKNPDISFEILIEDSRKITDKVLGQELYFGIVGAIMDPEKLNYQPLVQDELVVAATGSLLNKKVIELGELFDLPFILREIGSGTRKTMENILEGKSMSPNLLNVVATLGSTASVKEALKAGLGISILSRLAIKDEVANGALNEIRIKGIQLQRDFYMVSHFKRTMPQLYQKFYQFLEQQVSSKI